MTKIDKKELQELVSEMETLLRRANDLLGNEKEKPLTFAKEVASETTKADPEVLRIVVGRFDGQAMVNDEGARFPVPPNYASKSKLVEGDTLKLTITHDGSFIFKQIGPVLRRKAIGTVLAPQQGFYRIKVDDREYKVLHASITYFRVAVADKVTVVLPRDGEVEWAAIENVIDAESKPDEVDFDADAAFTVKSSVS